MSPPLTHVLVVDDSAVTRQVLSHALVQAGGLRVSVAADALIALRKIRGDRPDVIVLDLQLPHMDGLTFLRRVMAEDPIPVLVCSNLTLPDTEPTLRALEEGAIDVVAKPRFGVAAFLRDHAPAIIEIIRAAAGARPRAPAAASPAPKLTADAVLPPLRPYAGAPSGAVVAIGASTGGTEALATILGGLPADGPAVVVVQHMPAAFTGAFATRLDKACRISVREAARGDAVAPGRALVAPGDHHLIITRQSHGYVVDLVDGPPVRRHRPSVDVLFRSVARAAGPAAVGVLLTGMGDDGAQGLAEMRAAGAPTLVQDEESCVVFGMGREAVRRGAADALVSLPQIASEILTRFRRRSREW
ncbi:MAG TPA: chemotaxis response regulator protein-glutamate methylesterase [Polyangia bacterium]|jgi:two-component system chemotaxis response regulator CheB